MKKSALILALVALVSDARAEWKPAKGPLMTRWAKDVQPDKVLPEYPRPQMVRKEWKNLNGLWQLAFAGKDEEPPIGKKLPEEILVPFPVESALSGVMKHGERLWYRRTFTVPASWAKKRVLLHFGAVDWEATVWVNGKKLGSHRGGYDPFSFDITDALKKDGEQEVVVGVWDPTDASTQPRGKQVNRPGGIFYTPTTGIWQTVWIEPVNAGGWIESLTITPDVDRGEVKVAVKVKKTLGNTSYSVTVLEDGKKIAEESGLDYTQTVKVPNAKKWTPETPHLYQLRVHVSGMELTSGTDQVESYFGMRKIEVAKDDDGVSRILLNGKPVFQAGPLDQGFWPDGLYTAPTDAALKYDIEITKKLGFNMTRKHVKVEPARWYYWCDKLGLLVWQDMPSGDRSVAPGGGQIKRTPASAKDFEAELKAMIDARRNHPSIILWVVFNEGWGQYDTVRMTKWTKEYDPSRLADCASGWNDMKVGDVHDIHVYPGPGVPELEPSRAAVLGEFGGLGLGVDGHTWSKKENWGYRPTSSKEDLTRKYERLFREVWRLKEKKGLCAAVYTQITDVETEINGLLTYDREVIKVDLDRAAAAAKGDFSRVPVARVVVPTSEEKGLVWRYTLEKPEEGWTKPGFDASGWKEGPGGFGTKGTPGTVVRTTWDTKNIWMRREVELPKGPLGDVLLNVHHDEDAEIYINGVLAATVAGYTTGYEDVLISKEARASLKPGRNLIAIHCAQTTGGQYIDVGLLELQKKAK